MKKNAMLKIAAILMVAVLLTTCAISSTFAKYVTSGSTTSTARVAKWGVNLQVSSSNSAFAKVYKNGNNTVVNSSEFVIAPGTRNLDAASVSITGKPEVAATVTFTKTGGKFFALTGDWGTAELPIKFYLTVNGQEKTYTGTAQAIDTAINADLNTAFTTQSFTPDGKADTAADATKLNTSVVFGWEWAYEVEDKADTPDVNEEALRDALDTALGNAAANPASGKTAPTITINFAVSVEQSGIDWATTETVAP